METGMTSSSGNPPAPIDYSRADVADWSKHWSAGKQQSLSQRFFSFYRKAVFARGIRYFFDRYFPNRGLFVEAGSGTSETSSRIDKRGGARKLLALDIILPVLVAGDPSMDARLCGDIFQLPLRAESVDGLWNVGVMEHFTQVQIDAILREFHRVLKPGSRLILFWPGVDSVPQRLLRLAEFVINLRRSAERFRFHPAEISQLKSARQARDILDRNGFALLEVEFGFRTLLAFKTVVGTKR
jgi:SAM-dependent methyltransferase